MGCVEADLANIARYFREEIEEIQNNIPSDSSKLEPFSLSVALMASSITEPESNEDKPWFKGLPLVNDSDVPSSTPQPPVLLPPLKFNPPSLTLHSHALIKPKSSLKPASTTIEAVDNHSLYLVATPTRKTFGIDSSS
ncbi:hypothetical protein H2248_011375 [Termitomyces sp. 'cryptogamus']|nr:hypothetical protein H2248_011375 [Termitomyces sp. 'cryptogamus']